jgi:hypothetical protein
LTDELFKILVFLFLMWIAGVVTFIGYMLLDLFREMLK